MSWDWILKFIGNKSKEFIKDSFTISFCLEFKTFSCHRFFKQYLVLFFTNQMASALFRLAAALARDLIAATTFGSFILLILFANSGFVLSRGTISKQTKIQMLT